MHSRVIGALSVAVVAFAPAFAVADSTHAPPTLTPLVARDVAAACPGTAAYAEALVRGITDAEAAVAAPLFEACAAETRRGTSDRPNEAASTAVGAVYLAQALLHANDPALLQRAIDATAPLRSRRHVADAVVRQWPIIPDEFDARRREAVIRLDCPWGTAATVATYINVAAHAGTAWISQPREAMTCSNGVPLARSSGGGFPSAQQGGIDPSRRPEPAFEAPLLNPGPPNTPH